MADSTLRERTQEISAEYWAVRESQPERVAVAQLVLALAACEAALNAAARDVGPKEKGRPEGRPL